MRSALTLFFSVACTSQPQLVAADAQPVDRTRIENADAEPGNWLSYGRTYSEQRYSPLKQVNADNAKSLGLAWFSDLDTNRGQEATPLVIDGVVYVSTAWSMVKAYDGRTGRLLWSYDPEVPRQVGVNACCDVVSRGVAAWNGKIFVASLDGRLIALDAATGKPVWSTLTVDASQPYTITQAPRVIKGRVIIGNSGGEYRTRGYISAYDAETGKLDWRFFTVPGDPSKPFENEAMARAAKTWSGEWWKQGGGGPVWDAISYDPKLNLLYFGTGNGGEWDQGKRSLNRGDNLYISSIVAVNADTGAYVWHYQATPGDEWDYDAIQQLVLADLVIRGRPRQVIMQANKNGFFYVLDRKTGALISAKTIVPISWATGIDMKTGRPIENKDARYSLAGKPVDVMPGPVGAHSWIPMAFNPITGLVYIPAVEIASHFLPSEHLRISPIGWNIGVGFTTTAVHRGFLLAWDPVHQKEAWRVTYSGPWNGGIVTTAGNIVAQGDAAGNFNVYRADNGKKLWSMFAQSGIIGAPSTFEIDGEQYIAVLSGWGGIYPLNGGKESADSGNLRNISRILVFKLGGTATLPPIASAANLVIDPPPEPADTVSIARGESLFDAHCLVCHGENAISGGVIPDLRASTFLYNDSFYSIVLDGILQGAGMVSFKAALSRDDATAIRNYIIHRANQDKTVKITSTSGQ
jgi:alcohol dehydrogenase (cytochrome c)/quinohemoprotein ethanol dehydrogenase